MKRKNIFVIFSIALGTVFLLAAQCEKKEANPKANPKVQACKDKYESVIKSLKTIEGQFKEKKDKSSDLSDDVKIYLQNGSKNSALLATLFEKKKKESFDDCEKNPEGGDEDLKEVNEKFKEFSATLTASDADIAKQATAAKEEAEALATKTGKKLEDIWKLDESSDKK